MEGTYDVLLGGQLMGTATVSKQGLYWLFACRCKLSGEVMYQLVLQLGQSHVLGILVPEGDEFILRTRLPIKQLEQGTPRFLLKPRHAPMNGRFVPVDPGQPFAYLRRLERAHLCRKDGQVGLQLCDEE